MTVEVKRFDELVFDAGLQSRLGGIDQSTLATYMIRIEAGSEPPPVDVFELPDGRLVVSDGFHRCEALRRLGRGAVQCIIHEGTYLEAKAFGQTVNLAHGLAYTIQDKKEMLRDWLDKGYGGFVRDETGVLIEQPSQHALAATLGVTQAAISKWMAGFTASTDNTLLVAGMATARTKSRRGRWMDTTKMRRPDTVKTIRRVEKARADEKRQAIEAQRQERQERVARVGAAVEAAKHNGKPVQMSFGDVFADWLETAIQEYGTRKAQTGPDQDYERGVRDGLSMARQKYQTLLATE